MSRKMLKMSIGLLLVFFLYGCSGPSDSQIEQAVTVSLQRRVPVGLSRNLAGGEQAIISEVRIIDVGATQGSGSSKYWPVKVYAKGTCVVLFGGRQAFEGEAEFHVRKDPYGKWQASNSGL